MGVLVFSCQIVVKGGAVHHALTARFLGKTDDFYT
jgi:hypothetical protein